MCFEVCSSAGIFSKIHYRKILAIETTVNLAKEPEKGVLVHYAHAFQREWFDRARWLCFEVCSSAGIFSKIHYRKILAI
ncbi:MAG: hypothetical protein ACKO9Q_32775, partial [Pirellula sp.]